MQEGGGGWEGAVSRRPPSLHLPSPSKTPRSFSGWQPIPNKEANPDPPNTKTKSGAHGWRAWRGGWIKGVGMVIAPVPHPPTPPQLYESCYYRLLQTHSFLFLAKPCWGEVAQATYMSHPKDPGGERGEYIIFFFSDSSPLPCKNQQILDGIFNCMNLKLWSTQKLRAFARLRRATKPNQQKVVVIVVVNGEERD